MDADASGIAEEGCLLNGGAGLLHYVADERLSESLARLGTAGWQSPVRTVCRDDDDFAVGREANAARAMVLSFRWRLRGRMPGLDPVLAGDGAVVFILLAVLGHVYELHRAMIAAR